MVVLALAVGMLGHGVVTTHRLIAEHATDANRQLGATIRELATGADIVLCSEDLGVAIYYVGGFVVDGVSQETDLNLWVELVRAHAPGKRIAFFMDKARASEPIAARLRGLAAELPSDRWLVFHL